MEKTDNSAMDENEISRRVKKAFEPTLSTKDVQDYYEEWVGLYDNDLGPTRYNGPKYAAEFVDHHCQTDKAETSILDIAAGTGFVGEELVKRGFKNIDALDPSEKMLEIAKSKNIYRRYICEFITKDKTSIQENTYDFVVCSGGFVHGHIPYDALHEITRVAKIGGVVVIVMREAFFDVEFYKDKLRPLMVELQENGTWEEIEKHPIENYLAGNAGTVYVYRVLR